MSRLLATSVKLVNSWLSVSVSADFKSKETFCTLEMEMQKSHFTLFIEMSHPFKKRQTPTKEAPNTAICF